MAHVIHLSLLQLAVSLLPCFSARNSPYGTIKITPCDHCPVGWNIMQNCKCTDGKWILKFECGDPKVNQVTLEATKLSNPGVISKTCPTITYTTSSFLLSVQVEAGCVKISGGNNICRSCKRRATFSPPSNKAIHCISGKKIHISVPDKKKVLQDVHQVYDISDCIDAQTGSYPRSCNVNVTTTSVKNLEFYHENKSWIDALEQCQTDYTSLVEITNKTVNDEVKSLLQNATDLQQGVWIGLECSVFGKDKKWMWISKSKDIYSGLNSSIAESDNHCAKMILTKKQEIKLLDANCHDRLPFICQDFGEDAP